MKKLITSIIILISHLSFSQKSQISNYDIAKNEKVIVDFSKISKDSLDFKLNEFMIEMYKDCQNFIPNYLELSKDFISRTKIIEINSKEINQFKNISTVAIKSKCNRELAQKNAQNFELRTFNPIIYSVDFLKTENQIFRIYNTQYVLFIKSK